MSFLGSFRRAASAPFGSRRLSLAVFALVFMAAFCTFLLSTPNAAHAAAGINKTVNFQGRLLNAQGATVADGWYNIQFKIYQDGTGTVAGNPSGTLKWTESYVNNNAQTGVLVKNGFLSVNLGTNNPFASQVDWNQDTLWLSMNVAGNDNACTSFGSAPCAADGEMLPMKRMTATPYSLNSGALNGLTSSNFVQLAQGVQTDASTNTSSIFINKTSTGNLLQLQNTATDVFTVGNTGDLTFGSNANHTISVATSPASTVGRSMTLTGGAAGTGGAALAGGNLVLQGGAGGGTNGNGGDLLLDAGAKNGSGNDGNISIGTSRASTIQIGNSALASGTQTINIGNNNTSGGTTNVTIGAGGSATGGTTTLQAKGNITLNTNGTTRATFDTADTLYLGNGVTAAAPNSSKIQGTGSTTTAVSGGALTIQGGNATVGNANGGNVTLSGGSGVGTGAAGLVVLTTPTFQTATTQNCASTPCAITQANVDGNGVIVINTSGAGYTVSLPNPTLGAAAYGRIVYVTSASTNDFTLSVNGGGVGNLIAMRNNTTATMVYGANGWTAAGASSSTTLQSAYDNTLQSAGGAELVVSKTSTTNGLTIRDSSTNPVNGTLLSVQSSSAAGLLSVNSNLTEYASNAGAETAGGTSTTFPASTWAAQGSSAVSRNITTSNNSIATGQASVSVTTTNAADDGAKNTITQLTPNQTYNVSFTTILASGTFTDMSVHYSRDGGTGASLTACKTGQAIATRVWTKVNCTFTAPSASITSSNAIFIRQATATVRTFYVDNLSVTLAADHSYATDGSVDNSGAFSTNWPAIASATVTRDTSVGNDASSSAKVVATTAGQGVKNKLSVNPIPDKLYRITAYVYATAAFSTFRVQYTYNDSATTTCDDYNSTTASTDSSSFKKITCYIKTPANTVTNPYVYFTQTDSSAHTWHVDTFSMTLAENSTPNVQIGGGLNGGPTTLFTLDKGASAPIAGDNDALLGSMYYDTSLGKLQCYEADGWGACGSSPDNIITLSPEYTNAVMHGPSGGATGVGTMTSDLCSDFLNINDASNGTPICGTNETFNFYRWTSPQPSGSPQTYGIYVTYQLPGTFKEFASGSTSLMGRTHNGSSGGSATVSYKVFKNNPTSGLVQCGAATTVSTGTVSSWQTGRATGTADPSTCGFAPGDSIVFEIDVTASANANAYVGNLGFTFSNR